MTDHHRPRSRPRLARRSPPPPTWPRWRPCASPRSARPGSISGLLKTLGAMSPDERREQGPLINGLRDRVAAAIAARKAALEAAALDARLAAERVDLTLPAAAAPQGLGAPDHAGDGRDGRHLRRDGLRRRRRARTSRTTSTTSPRSTSRPSHPAREMHDTFFLKPGRRRRAQAAAHPHQPGAGAGDARANAPSTRRSSPRPGAADPHHRPGPHLPLRLRRHPHADVPPDRRPGDRPRHPHGPPEVDAGRLRAPLLRDRRASSPASARTTSRSPSPRRRWTCSATAPAAR